jgi:predicted MPP superfamily phosphohydrolase
VVFAGRRALRRPPLDADRRAFLARITGGAALAVATGEVVLGARAALGDAEVVDVPVTLERLPPGLDGFTIVQITDLHVGNTVGADLVADVVRRANALRPDLFVLTGDLVDGRVAEIGHRMAPLADLAAPHGVYSVTGNHEYFWNADEWIAQLALLGIPTLRNQRVEIRRGDDLFYLAGIDDHGAARFARGHGPNLAEALAGRDPSRAVVLLAHQPRQVAVAARQDVCFQLSGHTHGGQIWPWHYLVSLQQGGLVAGRYTRGRTQLYVSRGAGYWGPPVRVGAPAEITRVILRAS